MEIVIFILIGATAFFIGVTSYVVIKPNLFKDKLGYVPTPSLRPARAWILDKSKYEYGFGEVLGSTKLSPDKKSFRIMTKNDGEINAPYYRWELKPLDSFDGVAGDSVQVFEVIDYKRKDDRSKEELIELRNEIRHKEEETVYQTGLSSKYLFNTNREVDGRMQAITELKKAEKQKEVAIAR